MKNLTREIRIVGPIAFIPLTRGFEAVIDASDVALVAGRLWAARPSQRTAYAQSYRYADGRSHTIILHRLILAAPEGALIDHRDGNGLNNRRANLRFCSRSENSRNRPAPRTNSSGVKGVCWSSRDNRWRASIGVAPGVRKHLGLFLNKEDASTAYAAAAALYHGEFACLSHEAA